MGMIKEEMERLREKTDDEIMVKVSKQLTSLFPTSITMRALKKVMEERGIELCEKNIIMTFKVRGQMMQISLKGE